MAGGLVTGRKISLALTIRPHGLLGAFPAPWAAQHHDVMRCNAGSLQTGNTDARAVGLVFRISSAPLRKCCALHCVRVSYPVRP